MKNILLLASIALLLGSCSDTNKNTDKKPDATSVVQAQTALPEASIFNITDTFTNQHKVPLQLTSLRGKPAVVGMIFSHCGYACPRLTADMKIIHDKLGPKAKEVNFLLVSFDVARDTPARLEAYAKETELTPDWILLHGNEQAVRTLSVLLNVQYEKDADGNFSHSNTISVLDKDGVLAYQKEGLEADHTETIGTIEKMIP
ncbi:MAG: SCO family protein [Bacteroidetes bacterium]|nr:SCO family protein [Bacteroidota bacterium]